MLCIDEIDEILRLDRKFDIVVDANVKHVKFNQLM